MIGRVNVTYNSWILDIEMEFSTLFHMNESTIVCTPKDLTVDLETARVGFILPLNLMRYT